MKTLSERIAEDRIRIRCTSHGYATDKTGWRHRSWTVTLLRKGRQMTVPYMDGVGCTGDPDVADVLHCLISDASSVYHASGFLDWCDELEFDPDSISSRGTYQACQKVESRLEKFLGTVGFLSYIQDTELY